MSYLEPPQRPAGRLRAALVVYGDATTCRQCRRALEEAGFTVREADSGVTAVGAVRDMAPDVIVVDDQLRDVPGWQAAVWLRSMPALQATPIVMLGVKPADADAPSGPATWLSKPFSARTLQRALGGGASGPAHNAHLAPAGRPLPA
jgi:CheY-like chemotaxis protein